jgi:hypothetical protein
MKKKDVPEKGAVMGKAYAAQEAQKLKGTVTPPSARTTMPGRGAPSLVGQVGGVTTTGGTGGRAAMPSRGAPTVAAKKVAIGKPTQKATTTPIRQQQKKKAPPTPIPLRYKTGYNKRGQ